MAIAAIEQLLHLNPQHARCAIRRYTHHIESTIKLLQRHNMFCSIPARRLCQIAHHIKHIDFNIRRSRQHHRKFTIAINSLEVIRQFQRKNRRLVLARA